LAARTSLTAGDNDVHAVHGGGTTAWLAMRYARRTASNSAAVAANIAHTQVLDVMTEAADVRHQRNEGRRDRARGVVQLRGARGQDGLHLGVHSGQRQSSFCSTMASVHHR
jgi:hypothetical protein